MRHRVNHRKFGRYKEQRAALFKGLARSLIEHEIIKTTLPKAKDLRPYVERMVTAAKAGDLAARRRLFARLRDDAVVNKLFDIAKRVENRNGGYLRIVKCGVRQGDAADVAFIEFVDRA